MNLHLLLTSAPVRLSARYGRFVGAANTEPAFALPLLAAVASEKGAEVTIIEAASNDLTLDATLAQILEHKPDVLGITATTVGICAAAELALRVKQQLPKTLTLVGGCHATSLPEETLREFAGFDLAVIGEGEQTLMDILQHAGEPGHVPSGIPGTAERRSGEPFVNAPRPLIDDLDSLPLPAWSLLEGFPGAFHPSPARARRRPCASIVFTRGCPNQCTFCDRGVFGNRCRSYSPGYAVRMVRDLCDNYGVKEILIEDDTFVVSKKRVREFCEQLIAERVDITWSCLGRADRVDPDLLAVMKQAGCWHMSFGIESGSPDILRSINKNLDVDQMRQAVSWCRAAGIQTKGFFMTGFPGESETTLAATAQLACSLGLDDISVMQLTPFPGSELYATAATHGTFEKNWRKMNTIDTVFVPNGLTRESLEKARADMIRRFYLRPSVLFKKAALILRHPTLAMGAFRALLTLLKVTR